MAGQASKFNRRDGPLESTERGIEDPVESQSYEVEISVDPGIYCMQIVVNSETGGGSFSGINVEANVDISDLRKNFHPLIEIASSSDVNAHAIVALLSFWWRVGRPMDFWAPFSPRGATPPAPPQDPLRGKIQ